MAAPLDVQRAGDVTAAARAHVAAFEFLRRARLHQRDVAPAEALAHPRGAGDVIGAHVARLLDAGAGGTVVVHAPPPARQRSAPPPSTETRAWPRTSSTRKSHAACRLPSSS